MTDASPINSADLAACLDDLHDRIEKIRDSL